MLAGLALVIALLGGTGIYNHARQGRYYEPPQYWYIKSDSLLITPRQHRKLHRAFVRAQKRSLQAED